VTLLRHADALTGVRGASGRAGGAGSGRALHGRRGDRLAHGGGRSRLRRRGLLRGRLRDPLLGRNRSARVTRRHRLTGHRLARGRVARVHGLTLRSRLATAKRLSLRRGVEGPRALGLRLLAGLLLRSRVERRHGWSPLVLSAIAPCIDMISVDLNTGGLTSRR